MIRKPLYLPEFQSRETEIRHETITNHTIAIAVRTIEVAPTVTTSQQYLFRHSDSDAATKECVNEKNLMVF